MGKAKDNLRSLGNRIMSQEEQEEERALTSRLGALWKREEIYWKQRSRVKWLHYGDMNYKFFHQTTLCTRRRNEILRLKGINGLSIEGEGAIIQDLHEFYANLFLEEGRDTNSDRVREEVRNCVPTTIYVKDNWILIESASPEEISLTSFQMGGLVHRDWMDSPEPSSSRTGA